MGKVSSLIIWEQSTFFAALFMGMMFAFIYDCIRVFRRVFKHKHVYTMAVEDILFWFYEAYVFLPAFMKEIMALSGALL